MSASSLVRSAMVLIADHHREPSLTTLWISDKLQHSSTSLEQAFLECRGRSCQSAIQSYRLSRLFDRITSAPSAPLEQQVARCGFASVEEADAHFQHEFGIRLAHFHAVSMKAADDRLYRQSHPNRCDLIVNE